MSDNKSQHWFGGASDNQQPASDYFLQQSLDSESSLTEADLRAELTAIKAKYDSTKQRANELAAEKLVSIIFGNTDVYCTLNDYSDECAAANARWDHDPVTGAPIKMNIGEKLMLTVSELTEASSGENDPARDILLMQVVNALSRAMEGHRKGLKDDKLPHRSMFEVELADALIRIFHIAGYLGLDLEGAYREKMSYNASRQDHTNAARNAPGGKKY